MLHSFFYDDPHDFIASAVWFSPLFVVFTLLILKMSFDQPIDGPVSVIDVVVTMRRNCFILFCLQVLS
jgi:hypothetical protein